MGSLGRFLNRHRPVGRVRDDHVQGPEDASPLDFDLESGDEAPAEETWSTGWFPGDGTARFESDPHSWSITVGSPYGETTAYGRDSVAAVLRDFREELDRSYEEY